MTVPGSGDAQRSEPVAAAGFEPRHRSRRELMVAFGAIQLAMLLAALDQSIVATALPRIVGSLHGFQHLSWVVTGYIVASTVTMPLYGKLSDNHGRRALLICAISVFLLGSALCGAATSMDQLIAFRVLQGLGAGGLVPLAQAAVADLFSPRERGRYQGYVGAVWATASIAGPLVGGSLTDAISWRWIFYVNLPLGLIALLVVIRTMPLAREQQQRQRDRSHRLDYLGALLLTGAVTALLLVSVWGGVTYAWASVPIVVAAVSGVALLVLFVLHERRTLEPLLSLGLFRIRTMAVSSAAFVINGAALFGLTIYMPVYMQGVLGESATTSGVTLIPLSICWTITSAASGQVISRTGRYRIFPLAGSVLVAVGYLLLTQLSNDPSRLTIAGYLAIIGAGLGLMAQTYLTATQNAVPTSDIGVATAMLQFVRSIGASLAVALIGAAISSRLAAELNQRLGSRAAGIDPNKLLQGDLHLPPDLVAATREPLASAIHIVFTTGVPLGIAAVLVALALRELPLRQHS